MAISLNGIVCFFA